MSREGAQVVGRDGELALLTEYVLRPPGRAAVVAVRGGAGVGRTALLDTACHTWRRGGRPVLRVPVERPLLDVLLDAVRERYGHTASPRLMDSIAAASSLRARRGRPEGLALAHEVGRAVALAVGGDRCGVVAIDDADRCDAATSDVLAPVAEMARNGGVSVVFTARGAAATPLDVLVDESVALGPLSEQDVRGVLSRRLPRHPLDDTLVAALRTALGPLFGHPGVVLPTLRSLREAGRLVVVDEHWCLRGDDEIALPAEDEFVRLFRWHPSAAALAAVLTPRPLGLDDLVRDLEHRGADLGEAGTLLDELVAAGAVSVSATGDAVSLAVPALTAALRSAAVRERAVPPRAVTPARVRDLVAEGRFDEVCDQLERDLPSLVRDGTANPGVLGELAATYLAARLHEWRRCEPPEMTAVLRELGAPDPWQPYAAGRWDALARHLDRLGPTTPGAFFSLLAALSGPPVDDAELPPGRLEALRDAAAHGDLATVLEFFPRTACRTSTDSDFAGYRRVLRAYREGDWDAALSWARRMEARAPERRDAPPRRLARAIAAEACSRAGDHERADAWLRGVSHEVFAGHLVSWARCGLRYRTGRAAEALDGGWREYRWHREQGRTSGLDVLLGRLVDCAVREGEQHRAELGLAELEDLDALVRHRRSRTAVLLARGLVHHDRAALAEALRLARGSGDLNSVARACLALSELSDDPGPWLSEMYELTRRYGSAQSRVQLAEAMRQHGVVVPQQRARSESFGEIEARMVELVSDGCTNRQIAAVLHVSEKTVESHLTRIFARTGCRTRVELVAAWLDGRIGEVTA
ncbi:hypothetical protein GCM10025787_02440 [Saccharopolyspora rosea]|uniref:LuxR C-terminal-related transcriptional regulator n=1 Tax=Saccharopolyspora rosea TaxID=524884 RepID=A0ABW3FM56_9PSEU